MMILIFATMTAALAAAGSGPRWLAVASLLACLVLSAGLFLFEIHDRETGFAMPWLSTDAGAPAGDGRPGAAA